MKRRYFILIILLCSIQLLTAQLSLKAFAGVNVGWQGINIKSPSNDLVIEILDGYYSSVYKPAIGLQLNVVVNPYFETNFEIQYSEKGKKKAEGIHTERYQYLKYMHSFDIKVWDELKIGLGYYWGLQVGGDIVTDQVNYYGFSEDWDNGLVGSISYNIQRFTFRASYYYSLTDTVKDYLVNSNSITVARIFFRNRVFQVMLGYKLFNFPPKNS